MVVEVVEWQTFENPELLHTLCVKIRKLSLSCRLNGKTYAVA